MLSGANIVFKVEIQNQKRNYATKPRHQVSQKSNSYS
jgi:hypothetical protein